MVVGMKVAVAVANHAKAFMAAVAFGRAQEAVGSTMTVAAMAIVMRWAWVAANGLDVSFVTAVAFVSAITL